jgi:hypothetical protein
MTQDQDTKPQSEPSFNEECEVAFTCASTEDAEIASGIIKQHRDEIEKLSAALNVAKTAMLEGAFHHSGCGANWYSDNTKKDWNGLGEHREAKPCTCAHYKVDLALEEIQKLLDGEK